MFLIFILLLYPIMAHAVVTAEYCNDFTNQPDTCQNTAGCVYDNDIPQCVLCAAGSYCPGNNNEQILCSDVGNGNFDKSDEGSESSAECYESIEDGCYYSTQHAPDTTCRHYNTNDNPYRCGDN